MNPHSKEMQQFFLEIKEKLLAMGYDPDDIDINIEAFIYVSIQEEIKEAYYEFEQKRMKKVHNLILAGDGQELVILPSRIHKEEMADNILKINEYTHLNLPND
jgi:hypothetical protein